MNCENEDTRLQQLCEKLEPKITDILDECRQVLKKHGLPELTVASFGLNLDDSVKQGKMLESNIQAQTLVYCTYMCGAQICYRLC